MRGGERGQGAPNILVTHWSTDDIAPDQRFAAWVARPWPSLAPVFEIAPLEPFETRSDHVVIGGMVVQYGDGTARRYHRSARRAAADGIDMLGVSLLLTGTIAGKAGTRAFSGQRGAIVLLDLKRTCRFVFSQSASIQMAVPRALAERHLGSLDDLHGLVIPAPRSALLLKHLQACRKALPTLPMAQGPLLVGVILDLLAIAIGRGGETVAVPASALSSSARIAAERAIEARLGDRALSVEDVCAALQISRSSLYRLFDGEGEGGLMRYVQRRRLEQVRLALADVGNDEPIGRLAQRWGFRDAAHLSRTFQLHFRVSPTAYRKAAR